VKILKLKTAYGRLGSGFSKFEDEKDENEVELAESMSVIQQVGN